MPCVQGEPEQTLWRSLQGRRVDGGASPAAVMEQLGRESADFVRGRVLPFLDSLPTHYVLDDGALVVAHAGLKADLQGRAGPRVREFALRGEPGWAAEYRGAAAVLYGDTPTTEPAWLECQRYASRP